MGFFFGGGGGVVPFDFFLEVAHLILLSTISVVYA